MSPPQSASPLLPFFFHFYIPFRGMACVVMCQAVSGSQSASCRITKRLVINSIWWIAFLLLLLVMGAGSVRAVEYGDMVQKDGKWVFQSMEEDPVFKLMRDKGLLTNEEYVNAAAQTGKNWRETADASLIWERDTKWNRYLKTAMRLPDWVDLGIENRTRFESYDHPWRSTQKAGNGQTDTQALLRS